MRKRPVIGVPPIGRDWKHLYWMSNYLFAVWRAGGWGKVLRRTQDPQVLADYLVQCDGFLLPGGEDIDPAHYGRAKEPACGRINAPRDAFELALLRVLLKTEKPVLGICRGCQAMAVAAGGTLIQDITPLQTINHRDKATVHTGAHLVTVEPDSLLQEVLPPAQHTILVNTCHHQVVEQPGQGMRVVATSPDGFIEAIQREGHPFFLGVQWHPERMVLHLPVQQRIVDRFVAACRKN